jgi:plasmid stabilization system protein ParE
MPPAEMVINYTTRFVHEVDEQAEYLAQYSPARATLFVDSIFRQLDLLRQHPRLGRIVPEFRNDLVREVLFRQYRLIYRIISDDRIDVLALQTGLRPLQLPL